MLLIHGWMLRLCPRVTFLLAFIFTKKDLWTLKCFGSQCSEDCGLSSERYQKQCCNTTKLNCTHSAPLQGCVSELCDQFNKYELFSGCHRIVWHLFADEHQNLIRLWHAIKEVFMVRQLTRLSSFNWPTCSCREAMCNSLACSCLRRSSRSRNDTDLPCTYRVVVVCVCLWLSVCVSVDSDSPYFSFNSCISSQYIWQRQIQYAKFQSVS